MITAPDAVVIGLRALSFIALFQAAGTALFLWLFRSQLQTTADGLERLARIAAFGAIALTLAHHFLGPARMTGSFSGIFDASLQTLLLESSAGSARALRIGGLVLIVFGLRTSGAPDYRLTLLGVAAALGSFALIGSHDDARAAPVVDTAAAHACRHHRVLVRLAAAADPRDGNRNTCGQWRSPEPFLGARGRERSAAPRCRCARIASTRVALSTPGILGSPAA